MTLDELMGKIEEKISEARTRVAAQPKPTTLDELIALQEERIAAGEEFIKNAKVQAFGKGPLVESFAEKTIDMVETVNSTVAGLLAEMVHVRDCASKGTGGT